MGGAAFQHRTAKSDKLFFSVLCTLGHFLHSQRKGDAACTKSRSVRNRPSKSAAVGGGRLVRAARYAGCSFPVGCVALFVLFVCDGGAAQKESERGARGVAG